MDGFDIGQLIFTITLAVVPWMFPGLSFTYQIIFVLVVIVVSVIIAYFKLWKKYSELVASFKDVSQKHQAISEQFGEKQAEIQRYQDALVAIEGLIMTTAQSQSNNRLATMANYFEKIKYGLFGGRKES